MPTTVLPVPEPRGLVRRALASDLVDRLTAPHGIDRYLELVDPRWVVRSTRAEVVAVERQTSGTVTVTLAPTSAWSGFRAGQHVVVGVEIDGIVHERCFSLAGSPHRADGTLELTVKANPAGRVSRHLVDHAAPGLVLRLSEARGDFVLPEPGDRHGHLVLLSGGSGITPVLSMLRTLVDEGHQGPVTFVHYGYTLDDVCYLEELRELTASLSQGSLLLGLTEDPDQADLVGFFGAEHLAAITTDPHDTRIWCCGPPPLMAAVEQHLAEVGLADHLHTERFGPPPLDPDLDTGDGAVAFNRTGRTVPAEGTLLETAEAAGLSPAYGCRRGICGTCTTTKTSGVVRNVVTGTESAADAAPIRLCVSVACGEVAVDL